MDKSNKVTIRIDNKERHRAEQSERDEVLEAWEASRKEQAAALEAVEFKPAASSKKNKKKLPPKLNGKNGVPLYVKRLIASVVAAVVAGLVLGFVLLRMFVGITGDTPASAGSETVTGTPTTETPASGDTNAASGTASELPGVEAFVVQAGYFTTKEMAETWQTQYEAAGHSTYIWEQGNEFYVFAGVAPSEQAADQKAEEIKQAGLETFVKPWAVSGGTIQADSETANALSQVPELFNTSLQGTLDKEAWSSLAGKLPDEAPYQTLKTSITDMTAGSASLDVSLMKVWNSYQTIIESKK
ncbi:SPOR domain-containing protein [Thalassobacillus hwangdonensis]|uniref:SPOR domain-containing protein n=1 Tax=Thalassobacillus hwangdonensis TaxID=546108 RepID=UPI0036DE14E5